MHRIDADSPFYGPDAIDEAGASSSAELFLSLTGFDETIGQTIHARHEYALSDIVAGARFADVLDRERRAPHRLQQVPRRGSGRRNDLVRPGLVSKRKSVQFPAADFPARHDLVHELEKARIVGRLAEVSQLVDQDVFEALLGFLASSVLRRMFRLPGLQPPHLVRIRRTKIRLGRASDDSLRHFASKLTKAPRIFSRYHASSKAARRSVLVPGRICR